MLVPFKRFLHGTTRTIYNDRRQEVNLKGSQHSLIIRHMCDDSDMQNDIIMWVLERAVVHQQSIFHSIICVDKFTQALYHPDWNILLSPRFWETRDQPEPGYFRHRDYKRIEGAMAAKIGNAHGESNGGQFTSQMSLPGQKWRNIAACERFKSCLLELI